MRAVLLVPTLILAAFCGLAQAEEKREDFPPLQLTDTKGQVFEVKDYVGTVSLLNFWAFWCGPCRAELPELQKLYNSYAGKGFTVVAVAVDTPREMVKPFMEKLGVSLPVAFIDPQLYRALGIESLPFSVLIDKQGKIARVYAGYAPAVIEDIRKQVAILLKEPKKHGGK
jgi:thiol-disulfide isomerase/thioredoxin